MIELEKYDRLQIQQAAAGMISGHLREWPALQEALQRRGVRMSPLAPAAEMRRACQSLEPLPPDQYQENLLAHGITDWRSAECS